MRSRKSQLGSTVTWFGAVVVIVFILAIFNVFSVGLMLKKGVSKADILEISDIDLLKTKRVLINFLGTSTDGGELMVDSILESVDNYILPSDGLGGKSFLDKYSIELDELSFWLHSRGFRLDELDKIGAHEKEEELYDEIEKALGNDCDDYMLRIPQGIFWKKVNSNVAWSRFIHDETEFFAEQLLEQNVISESWTDWVVFEIPHKGQIIKIGFRRPRECS